MEGPVEGHADVAVVGGGFTGLSAALALAKRGARRGARRGRPGRRRGLGAQRRALQQRRWRRISAPRPSGSACRRRGRSTMPMTPRWTRWSGSSASRRSTATSGAAGKIKLAAKPEHFDGLARGLRPTWCARSIPDRISFRARRCAGNRVGFVSWRPRLSQVRATCTWASFAAGLADAAARHGAVIHENAPVTALRRLGGRKHEIVTGRGHADRRPGAAGDGDVDQGALRLSSAGASSRSAVSSSRPGRCRRCAGGPDADAADGDDDAAYRPLFPHHAGRAPAVRRPGPVCHVQPDFGRQERGDPRARHARDVPAVAGHADRLLLGRTHRHDRRPAAAGGEHEGLLYAMGYSGHGRRCRCIWARQWPR